MAASSSLSPQRKPMRSLRRIWRELFIKISAKMAADLLLICPLTSTPSSRNCVCPINVILNIGLPFC